MLLHDAKKFYSVNKRSHLPWRHTRDPYKIVVSEVMLQQTQVDRVVPYFNRFIKRFPNVRSLATADLPEVLKLWQGLGYNRRGKMLRDTARIIVEKFNGRFPKHVADIESLPGIGPYTARAISAFAYNQPEIFIETNIRTAFFHHYFWNGKGPTLKSPELRSDLTVFSDRDLLPLVEKAHKKSHMEPREFYAMLMDYGSFLKKSGVKLNARSKHYAKQSKFQGSRRQLRGQILRLLLEKPQSTATIICDSGRKEDEVREELTRLQKEKLIILKNKKFYIAK